MFTRIINLPKKHSFFLFGARGTGKTELLKSSFKENTYYIDLLNLEKEAEYQLNPESLYQELSALDDSVNTIIIDEIQKVPKLLDVVHRKIEEKKLNFILTGSSARKLKHGSANLLAGRAFVFELFPLTISEIGSEFNLQKSLEFGMLPQVVNYDSDLDKKRFLKAYANTYLKEEIWGEHLIRKIEPFRMFLQVAAQSHGQQINYYNIAKDIGVDSNTVKNYYSILEDTLLGFRLSSYSGSIRKQLKKTPKFYLFDTGVKRALDSSLDFQLKHGSFEYGICFETLVISEIMRRFSYAEIGVAFSYFATDGGAEIDLLISQGSKVRALIEIKSSSKYQEKDAKHIKKICPEFKQAKAFLLYSGNTSLEDEGLRILPWLKGIDEVLNLFS